MKTSKLSKDYESTELCVLKSYSSVDKTLRIFQRCLSRPYTHRPLMTFGSAIAFQYVKGKPLIDCGWIVSERYLNRYMSTISPVLDSFWSTQFYCKGPRAEHLSVLERIPTILNLNWHGDMCRENVIVNGYDMTDIDLREDPYGDVYYDLAKFNRSLYYNSLTDKFTEPDRRFKSWCITRCLDWDAIELVTAIAFRRMGRLHNRQDFIELGDSICKV